MLPTVEENEAGFDNGGEENDEFVPKAEEENIPIFDDPYADDHEAIDALKRIDATPFAALIASSVAASLSTWVLSLVNKYVA